MAKHTPTSHKIRDRRVLATGLHLSLLTVAAYSLLCLLLWTTTPVLMARDALQRDTELLYWDATRAQNGYNFFGVGGTTYLIDMEGKVCHTWPIGTNPHLLTNGNVLDAATNDPSGFGGFKEVNWDGAVVWSYLETRSTYHPHHDFTRIYNPKLRAFTTLYIANKDFTYAQLVAAGADPIKTPSTGAQLDAIVEVDSTGTVVWEWCFFDHIIQDLDASKPNHVGSGKTIANYPNKLNINLTGHTLKADWLHCNSIDYNEKLDQIVINSVQGEFYVIDHGNTFVVNNPSQSITLAASSAGDFLYRFGDPARYNQGDKTAILEDWTQSTTGDKQLGGAHHIQWIADGLPGAGNFLIFNNSEYLCEHTPQSYVVEINPYLDASGNHTGAYVNPPDAGYTSTSTPADSSKPERRLSKQIVWNYATKLSQTLYSNIGCSAQRLPNGNTLICADTWGYIMEVTPTGETVWDYIQPVTNSGSVLTLGDRLPMVNSIFRAYRYLATDAPLLDKNLTSTKTIAGRTTVRNPYQGNNSYTAQQRPTELLYLDSSLANVGYTLFAANHQSYLINMQGQLLHSWPAGKDPCLLTSGNLLDWKLTNDTPQGLIELNWNGETVWQHNELRSKYHPHGAFKRIFNQALNAYTTLYLANKDLTNEECLSAGCNPANAPYTNAQVDTIVEVDQQGNVIWEWSFWDHTCQSIDSSKSNYISNISNAPGKINLNLPGHPLQSNWLDCNSIDFNPTLNHVVINSRYGEFYIIDHGNTFVANDPTTSIIRAASPLGDFLYRFGDPARYNQGNPPSVGLNWETASAGHKQIGGSSNVQWIESGLSGAGNLLVFNNNHFIYQRSPQSYVFEINPYLTSSGSTNSSYVNPPTAGYNTWTFDKDTMNSNQSLSKQVIWKYSTTGNLGLFSHQQSSAQRLSNGNTLICASDTGYLLEITSSGAIAWEYINPVTTSGIATSLGDRPPLTNGCPRATRYLPTYAGFSGVTFTPTTTIAGRTIPSILSVSQIPTHPTASQSPTIRVQVSGNSPMSTQLTYQTGSGSAVTSTPFVETMATTSSKPWTGGNASYPWTVTGSYFEQRTGSNYGTGNPCGIQYKGGTTLNALTSAMLTTTNAFSTSGVSGSIEFYIQSQGLESTDGWTLQIDSGSGFITRASELSGSNHLWQKFHYDLAPSELNASLKIRFQFTGGGTNDVDDRIDLDQIIVTTSTGGTSTTTVTMNDDGQHNDSLANDCIFAATIPPHSTGTEVRYYITLTDADNQSITLPALAPTDTYSYTVSADTILPTAHFSALPTTGSAPLHVTFVDDSSGVITSRLWDFGDGTTLTTTDTVVTHPYTHPGIYSVKLTVSAPTGSNTYLASNAITTTSKDTIGDGIPDWWRALYFGGDGTTTTPISIASSDADGDGQSNKDEYLADTNPTNGQSHLKVEQILKGATVTIQIKTSRDRVYSLYSSPTLTPANWSIVNGQSKIQGNGDILQLTDPTPSPTRQFYQIGVQIP